MQLLGWSLRNIHKSDGFLSSCFRQRRKFSGCHARYVGSELW